MFQLMPIITTSKALLIHKFVIIKEEYLVPNFTELLIVIWSFLSQTNKFCSGNLEQLTIGFTFYSGWGGKSCEERKLSEILILRNYLKDFKA
jgi:hypothetical protein